jgi:ribosome-associated protein
MRREIPIEGTTIRLGQLLKLAGIVDSGSGVKTLVAAGTVLVNGEPETRRGRQLRTGDSVQVGDHQLRVVAASSPAPPDERGRR